MLVYRVEHTETKKGPFTYYCPTRRLSGMDIYHDGNWAGWIGPEPDEEGLPFQAGAHLCGCQSISTLRRWFGSPIGMRKLLAEGFQILELEIREELPPVVGKHQVIFRPDAVLSVRRLKLEELYGPKSDY